MKTYIFDFDGTLVDSMPSYVNVMLKILDDYKVNYPADIIKIITPLGFKGTAEYFLKLGMKESIENLWTLMSEYAYKEYAFNIPAKENVIETIK